MDKFRGKYFVACGAITALLAGCAVGPDFEAPKPELNEKFMNPAPSGETIANLKWWDIFTDPILQDLIRSSLDANKDLMVAIARVEQARAILGFTRADQFPRVDLVGGANRLGRSDNLVGVGKDTLNNFRLLGDLTFEIDIWGKLRRATEAQRAELLASEYTQRAVIVSLIAEVASTYFQMLGAENRLEISRQTVKNRHSNTGLVNARLKNGISPELDLNQAQIEEFSAAATLVTYEREMKQAENALSVLLGKTPYQVPRGYPLFQQTLREDVPVGFPADLLRRRPDLMVAENQLHAEVARIGVARANRLPGINLMGFVGLQSNDGKDFPEARSNTWSIGGGLLGPLIDFGKSRSAEEAAKASADAALASYEQSVLQAVREVEDALVGIKTAKEGYAQRELQRKAASNASRLSHARYDEGVTPYLEVLDVERSLFSAELDASVNRERYLVSVVQLYKSLGGGWEENKQ